MACLVSAFVSKRYLQMPQVSWHLAAASLSSFSVPQSGQTQTSSLCLIVLLQLFSLSLSGTSCISVWHYLQPGVTLQATSTWSMPPTYFTWLQSCGVCGPQKSQPADELLQLAWPCDPRKTSNILTTFHNLLYMSLSAMVSCIRISTWDLTGSKFIKRTRSLSMMEAAYLSAGAEFHPHHFQLLCYTALTGAIQTSDVSCSVQCN